MMANQYSITVSDESDRILKQLKEHRVKTSQAIDEAIKTLGKDALHRLVSNRRVMDNRAERLQELEE